MQGSAEAADDAKIFVLRTLTFILASKVADGHALQGEWKSQAIQKKH